MSDLAKVYNRVIEYSFYLLFFLVPLIMTPWNYELFEFNKMLLVYLLTAIIVTAWLIKIVLTKKFLFQQTFMDIPLLLFLASQFTSTFLSIDRHTSFWGYYSRFHGGLVSTVAYLLLYWAFVSNMNQKDSENSVNQRVRKSENQKIRISNLSDNLTRQFSETLSHPEFSENHGVRNSIYFLLSSAFLVTSYGIAERFGIDAKYWVQDVQNRVFSTLGQPNWLAAWIVALLPIPMALAISETKNEKRKTKKNVLRIAYYLLPAIFYICILYTKSRSSLLGFAVAYLVFWGLTFWLYRRQIKNILKPLLLFTISYSLLAILIGTPWTPNVREISEKLFPFSPAKSSPSEHLSGQASQPVIGYGTESGDIRKIVWKGAIEIWKHHLLLGTGPETFAYSYYWYRPREHNDVSEWDFLYNKAHNEYLNYAATTGLMGLGSYLLVIGSFVRWCISKFIRMKIVQINNPNIPVKNSDKKFGLFSIRIYSDEKDAKSINSSILILALLSGYFSMLVTNFFGFSVVPIALLFFLYPAFAITLTADFTSKSRIANRIPPPERKHSCATGTQRWLGIGIFLFFIFYFLFFILKYWYADTLFARGGKMNEAGRYQEAFQVLQKAIKIYPSEPNYHDELGQAAASLAVLADQQKDATFSSRMAEMAINESDQALKTSPYHLNFWKNRVRVFYRLAEIDPQYNERALKALLRSAELAPTDAKLHYNLALMLARMSEDQLAIETMEKTIELKPDYDSAYYALALFYEQEGRIQEARQLLEHVLTNINPNHKPSREKLEAL